MTARPHPAAYHRHIIRARVVIFSGVLFASVSGAQTLLGPSFWDCQTNMTDGGHASTQVQAAAQWISIWHGQLVQSGPCGALGTANYRFCPLNNSNGQSAGGMDVFLYCPTGFSPDGLTCPGEYYVSTDRIPLAH